MDYVRAPMPMAMPGMMSMNNPRFVSQAPFRGESEQSVHEQVLFASRAYAFINVNNQWKNILENTPSKLFVFNEDGRFILLAKLESTDEIVCDILLTQSMVTYQTDPDPKWHHFTVRENPPVTYGLMLLSEEEGRHFAVLIQNLLKTASGNIRYSTGAQRVAVNSQASYQQSQSIGHSIPQQNQIINQANYQQNFPPTQEKTDEQVKRIAQEQLQDQISQAEPKQRLLPANKQKVQISKIELLCDMLAEAIEFGTKEKAQEFACQLAEGKANVTIQLLNVEDNQEKKPDHTISLMVQVEDKETSGPTFRLQVNPAKTTIGMLKNTVFERYDFPREIQRWVIGKRLPKDNESLERCGVKSTGTMICLYLLSAKEVKQPETDNQQQQQQHQSIQDFSLTDEYHSGFYENLPGNQSLPVSTQSNVIRAPMVSMDGRQLPPPVPKRDSQKAPQQLHTPHAQTAHGPPQFQEPYNMQNQPRQGPVRQFQQDVMAAQRPVTPPPKGWQCQSCTYVNIPTRPGCEICGSDRPANYKIPLNIQVDEKERSRLEKERLAELMAVEAEKFRKEQEQMEAQRNFAAILQIADRELVPSQAEFECPVCFVPVVPGDGIILRDCLHTFCKECLAETIKNSNDPDIKCPFNDGNVACDANITGQEIRALLTEEDFVKYLQRSLSTAEGRSANSFHCKTPNCTSWCEYEDDVNWFRCPTCIKLNCLTCKAIHEGQTCKEYQANLKLLAENDEAAKKTQEMLENMLKKGEAMNCPQCKIVLQKKDGCDWMRCSMCRTEICWATKGPRWGEKGNGDTSGGCKCRYNGKRCHPECKNCH